MSEFKELYKIFKKNYKDDRDHKKHLEFDEDNNLFWLIWGDESLYELS